MFFSQKGSPSAIKKDIKLGSFFLSAIYYLINTLMDLITDIYSYFYLVFIADKR